jgi:uncharacterized membrane protein YczE
MHWSIFNVVFLFGIAFVENDYTKVFKTTWGSLKYTWSCQYGMDIYSSELLRA